MSAVYPPSALQALQAGAQKELLTQSTWRTTAPCRRSSLEKMSLGNSCRAREQRENQLSTDDLLKTTDLGLHLQHGL